MILPERMSAVRKFCYYSRWQYCHPGHATCSIQELFTVSGGLEMILPLKRCKEVSAHAKLVCSALKKDFFFPWEVTKKFWSTMQISFPGQLRRKISCLLIFCLAQSKPGFCHSCKGSHCEALRVRYFNYI